MLKLRKMAPSEPLIVPMTGVRMGDQLLIVGSGGPKVVAQLALKPGLTGRTCLVDERDDAVQRAVSLAEVEGALVEPQVAPVTSLPYPSESFDLVAINHLLPQLGADQRAQCLAEAARVLRGGGRCVVIHPRDRGALGALFGGGRGMPASEVESLMSAAGLRAVHTLAEREGLLFVEGARRA